MALPNRGWWDAVCLCRPSWSSLWGQRSGLVSGQSSLNSSPFGALISQKVGCPLGLHRVPAGVCSIPRGAPSRLSSSVCSGGRGSPAELNKHRRQFWKKLLMNSFVKLVRPYRLFCASWVVFFVSLLLFFPLILTSLAFNVRKIVETLEPRRITPGLCVLWRVSRASVILIEPPAILLRCCGLCLCLLLIAGLEQC